MILTPTNRMVEGLVTRIFDPQTGKSLDEKAVIDVDTLSYPVAQHFIRAFMEGDMKVYEEPVIEAVQNTKQTKVKE